MKTSSSFAINRYFMQRVKISVEVLDRQNSSLLTAEAIIDVLLSKKSIDKDKWKAGSTVLWNIESPARRKIITGYIFVKLLLHWPPQLTVWIKLPLLLLRKAFWKYPSYPNARFGYNGLSISSSTIHYEHVKVKIKWNRLSQSSEENVQNNQEQHW